MRACKGQEKKYQSFLQNEPAKKGNNFSGYFGERERKKQRQTNMQVGTESMKY